MSKEKMSKDELIELSLGFFECFINRFQYIEKHLHSNDIDLMEHNLNNLKGEAIRSYDFIKYYKDKVI